MLEQLFNVSLLLHAGRSKARLPTNSILIHHKDSYYETSIHNMTLILANTLTNALSRIF